MEIPLSKGERLQLHVGNGQKNHVRIKGWVDNTCVCVSFGAKAPLACGTAVEMERLNGTPRAFYYLEVSGHPEQDSGSLMLRRIPSAAINQRRNAWRVPYTASTAIRPLGACHFLSAQFSNLSMDAACVLSEIKLATGVSVELRLSLPEYPTHIVPGVITRASEQPLHRDAYGKEVYGLIVRFNLSDSRARRHLTMFMWQRIRDIYPKQMRRMYETAHSPRSQQAGNGAPPA